MFYIRIIAIEPDPTGISRIFRGTPRMEVIRVLHQHKLGKLQELADDIAHLPVDVGPFDEELAARQCATRLEATGAEVQVIAH